MMFRRFKMIMFSLVILLCFTNMTCDSDGEIIEEATSCDFKTIVDRTVFHDLESDNFNFVDAQITGDCLSITFGASGCNGESWAFKLVDSEAVTKSIPGQRSLKFQLENKELCEAYFEKTVSFDLTPLQLPGDHEVLLNIQGLSKSLSYKY
ncbi:hypothetical protein VOI54_00895 [Tamlana sp. 2201CG12-4]|uniref:hypothetical protein n=1 Tax=Tamlana sp. 2201CG12-4 TaxID=3112582 RepID=UPI002DBD1E0F|nr:hypothetical protein [Tamlana sp. 2201CG12-4]MEC3905563.1 hypothetical protein [Tamlana sp. 2201CG12-4]